MFTQLGALFKTGLRQANTSDPRPQARRDHAPDKREQPEGGDAGSDAGTLWADDSAEISIFAAKAWLGGYTAPGLDSASRDAGDDFTVTPDLFPHLQPKENAPATPRMARAALAYGATAAHAATPPPSLAMESALDPNFQFHPLTGLDKDRVRRLLADLDRLAEMGVSTLRLGKGDDFFRAMENAASSAMAQSAVRDDQPIL